MPGCKDCKYHETSMEYSDNTPEGHSPFITTYMCMAGNTLKCRRWWKDNGSKPSDAIVDDMSCFKHTRLAEHLMLMDSLVGDMSTLLDTEEE